MKSITILATFILFIGLAIIPASASADTPQSAQALQINDTTVMFLIDFQMTASAGEYEVPIIASSRVDYNDRADIVGYSLKSSDANVPTIESVSGFVLSTAAINDTHYTIAEDTTESFRLAIFATFRESITSDAVAQITKLPYWINDRRTTVHQNQLDDLGAAVLTVN